LAHTNKLSFSNRTRKQPSGVVIFSQPTRVAIAKEGLNYALTHLQIYIIIWLNNLFFMIAYMYNLVVFLQFATGK
jgi:hypothetical protein